MAYNHSHIQPGLPETLQTSFNTNAFDPAAAMNAVGLDPTVLNQGRDMLGTAMQGGQGIFSNIVSGIGEFAQNNRLLTAAVSAVAMSYADGDDGWLKGSVKGIGDFAASYAATDGDTGFVTNAYLAFRGGSIANNAANVLADTMGVDKGFWGSVAAYAGGISATWSALDVINNGGFSHDATSNTLTASASDLLQQHFNREMASYGEGDYSLVQTLPNIIGEDYPPAYVQTLPSTPGDYPDKLPIVQNLPYEITPPGAPAEALDQADLTNIIRVIAGSDALGTEQKADLIGAILNPDDGLDPANNTMDQGFNPNMQIQLLSV